MKEDFIDIRLSTEVLQISECYDFVQDNMAGGNAIFVGTVRGQTRGKLVERLEFEAFRPMAIKEMKKIALSMFEKWSAVKVSFHHRTGILNLGDIAVIIAVSCPHRADAFEACQYGIDTLKQTVPIWKKEVFEDGEEWVAAHP